MSLEMWSQLRKYGDGDSLDAKTLNVPIGQLGDRTAYLYARLREIIKSGTMSAVILTDVELSTDTGTEPSIGNAVYLDNDTGRFTAAKATMSLYDDFTASDSAFTVGILQTKNGNTGNVIVYGAMDLNPDGSPVLKADMIESGEDYRPGRYYLSASEAGHLTANPTGPRIYVCTITGSVVSGGFDGSAIVTPQYLDIGTSHVHRTAVLKARPAGTSSTAGYLPVDATYTTAQVGPLALRFGGAWTADGKVDYRFYLDQSSAEWPNGVVLRWTEDGGDEQSVTIHAPDEVVSISNGLTARLSLPASGSSVAYADLSENQRTWASMTFPDAGTGWLDHEPVSVASSSAVDGFCVMVSGRIEDGQADVSVCFPGKVQVLTMGAIADGNTFTYNGTTYQFTVDESSYTGDYTPVSLGSCLADSTRYLAEKLNTLEIGKFAVFEDDDGASAKMLIMDGSAYTRTTGDTVVTDAPASATVNTGFDVIGASSVTAVVMDGNAHILTDTYSVTGIGSYAWKSAGDISLMLYQSVTGTVTVPAGTTVSCTMTDDEPDAIYDYVIGMDRQIADFWPPVPPKSAALVVNGVEMDNRALFPDDPTVSFGLDTIHWFSDESGKKPWPESLVSRDAEIDPAYDKTEVMHWVRGFQGATGPVTSLQARSGSPIRIYGYGTNTTANTGDLEIDADFDFRMVNGGTSGFVVPKRVSNGRMICGPVVERIIGGAGVNIVSKAGCPSGQGSVVIALDNGSYKNQFSDVALENAEQSKIGMFPYIRLKGYTTTITSPSAFTAFMRVPTNLPDGSYALRVSASVFGETGFTDDAKKSACINLEYNILPDFSAKEEMRYRNLKSTLVKPDSSRTVLIPFGHWASNSVVYNGFDPVYVTTEDSSLTDADDIIAKVLGASIPSSAEFVQQEEITPELRPGYLVGIRISRAVTDSDDVDPYTGAIGIINLTWDIVSKDGE